MPSIQMTWKRIEIGFEMLHASALWNAFQPGAMDVEIQEAEGFLRITFPDEVKTSYHLHNGSNGKKLIGDPNQMLYQLYSLREILHDWQQEIDLQRQIDQRAELSQQDIKENTLFGFDQQVRCNPPDRGWWWHPKWIPLLRSDSGVRLCLDLAPGPAGRVGQIIQLDFDSGDWCPPVVASSWRALLLTFVQDIEAGEYRLREDIFGGMFLSFA